MPQNTSTVTLSFQSEGLRAGIHLFLVAERVNDHRLSADVKANIPNRAVFTITSAKESKYAGVEKAEDLKEGEMIFKIGSEDQKKIKTIFTPEVNVKEIVEAVNQNRYRK